MGPVLGPDAGTDRTRNTQVAEPWLPAPEDGGPGEGQRLTPDAPHNSGRPPPPGTVPHHPRGTQTTKGVQAKETVLGPNTHTPVPTARGWRTQTARSVGGQSREGERLTTGAPHNGGRHPPPGTPFRHPHSEQCRPARAHAVGPVLSPHARTDRTWDTRVAEPWLPAPEDGRPGEGQRLTPDAPHNGGRPSPPGDGPPTTPAARSPDGACRPRGQCWAPTPTHPRAQHVGGRPQQPAQWAGSRGRDSAWPQTPLTMVEGTPPGDALPPPQQRAKLARKGARCGARAGSPRRHRPHPEHTGGGTLAARSRGRQAGGGTAPDTRCPSQWWKAPRLGMPFRQPHSEQRRPARAHAVGPVLGPHARTDRTRDTRVAEPRLPAPEDGRPGEGQRLTPDAPRNGGRPSPPGTAPYHPQGTQPPQGMQAKGTVLGPHIHTPTPTARGWRTPTARPVGGQSEEGQRLTSDAPDNGGRHPPPGTPSRHFHSEQRRPARAHAVGPVLGPHASTDRIRDTRVTEPRLPAPEDGRPGEGQRLAPDAPHNGGRQTPPGTAPHHPRGTQPPQGVQAKGTVLGPHIHTPAPTARGWRTPTARSLGGQSGEGERLTTGAPHNGERHPPRGRPFRHPHSEQCRPAKAHAVGPVLSPHARTDRTRDTRVAEPWLPAPEDGRPGEGQRLTPDAPHNGGRPLPPRGRPPTTPAARSPHGACRPRGQCWAPKPTHPRAQHVGGGPQQPAQWAGSRGRDSAWPQTPLTMVEGTPPGDAPPPPQQRAKLARKGARCGAGCLVPTPAPTAP